MTRKCVFKVESQVKYVYGFCVYVCEREGVFVVAGVASKVSVCKVRSEGEMLREKKKRKFKKIH